MLFLPLEFEIIAGGDISVQIHSVRVPLRQLRCLPVKEVAQFLPEMLKPCVKHHAAKVFMLWLLRTEHQGCLC